MPVGAGLYPAGLAAAGFGLPETLTASPNAPLPDATTGQSQTGRFISQTTSDYVVLPDGRLQGMPTVEQLVLIAIRDIDFSDMPEKGANFQRAFASRVQVALSDLITRKLVQIRQVVVTEPTQDSGLGIVDWVDLTNGKPVQTRIQ